MARTRRMNGRERQALADLVLARARRLDDIPDMGEAELEAMSDDDLFAYLESHGVSLDRERTRERAETDLGVDLRTLERGVTFDDAAQERFEARVDATVQKGARLTAKDVMGSFREQVFAEADPRPDYERFSCWVAKLRRSCRSCEELHGTIYSEAQWDDVGRPRAGTTLCGGNCECDLVPVAVTREDTRSRLDEINRLGPRRQAVAAALAGA